MASRKLDKYFSDKYKRIITVKEMEGRIKNLNNYIGKTQIVMFYKWMLHEGKISKDGAAVKRMKHLQLNSKRKNIIHSKHINKATKDILLDNIEKEGVGDARTSWRNKVKQK